MLKNLCLRYFKGIHKLFHMCLHWIDAFKTTAFMEPNSCYYSFTSRLQKTDPVWNIIAFGKERRPRGSSLRTSILHSKILISAKIGVIN